MCGDETLEQQRTVSSPDATLRRENQRRVPCGRCGHPLEEVGSQNAPARERGHDEGPWEGSTRPSTGLPSRMPRGTCSAGHPEGSALESGEWLMSTFRCAANGAARSWISPIQVPGRPGRPISSGPAWHAAATFGRPIRPRKRPMPSSGPMERGNATLATTLEAPSPEGEGFSRRAGCLRRSLLIGQLPRPPVHFSNEPSRWGGVRQARVRQAWKAGPEHRELRLICDKVRPTAAVPMHSLQGNRQHKHGDRVQRASLHATGVRAGRELARRRREPFRDRQSHGAFP